MSFLAGYWFCLLLLHLWGPPPGSDWVEGRLGHDWIEHVDGPRLCRRCGEREL